MKTLKKHFTLPPTPRRLYLTLTLAVTLIAAIAWAQHDVLMNGLAPNGNITRLSVTSSGAVNTGAVHAACINTTMNVGTTGTACPATPSSTRSSILIQLVQVGQNLTVTSDGATIADSTNGVQIASGSIYTDNLAGTVSTNCRCDAATCSVRIVECP